MADEPKVRSGHVSILRRMRPHGLAALAVVLISLAVWGFLIAFKQFPQLSAWKVQLGLALAAVLALFILWKAPQWQVAKISGLEPKDQFDRVNEARKTLAQIVGGIAVLAGFYATVQNINLSQQSFALAQEGQITDRFAKAIEQLGAVNASGDQKVGGPVGRYLRTRTGCQ